MKSSKAEISFICRAAVIAALYVVLTLLTAGVSSGFIQIRISEALCVLAVFTPAAIPGMFVGCVVANLISGCAFWDIIFGSLATLVGTCGVYLLRKYPYIAPLPYVAANTVTVPLVLYIVYQSEEALPLIFLSIGISETISAYVLGIMLYQVLKKYSSRLFRDR